MVGLVKPYSAYENTDVTAENFPSLLSFFPCNETAGDVITDQITSLTFNVGSGKLSYGVTNAITAAATGTTTTIASGTMPAVKTAVTGDVLIFFGVYALNTANFTAGIGYGDVLGGVGTSIGLYGVSSTGTKTAGWVDVGAAAGRNTPTGTDDSSVPVSACVVADMNDAAENVTMYVNDTAVVTAVSTLNSTAIADWTAAQAMVFQDADMYMMGLVQCRTRPSDEWFAAANEWMLHQAVNGNKVPYPGFALLEASA